MSEHTNQELLQFKKLLQSYVNCLTKCKQLKIERQRLTCDIRQQELLVSNMQDQVLQAMEDLNIEEDEIKLGNNTIIQRSEQRKTKSITLKDIEEEFIRQNGNALTFTQILNDLREQRKNQAEVKHVLKVKTK